MDVRYIASVGTPKDERKKWGEKDSSCFEKVKKFDAYAEEVYFYPTSSESNVWLEVLGHEKATKDKANLNRMWTSKIGIHLCVGGKGYYNDILITRGMCFVSWPYLKHNIVADKDDPFEFYWLLMSGSESVDFVNACGLDDSCVVFNVEQVDDVVKLFELGINTNYANVDAYSYTMGLSKMILSFHKPQTDGAADINVSDDGRGYTQITKKLLKHSNYTLSIIELSKKIGVTPKHLSKVFYSETGEGLKQYIVRKKFDVAGKMMRNGVAPTEVALILKYSNYSSFHRMFVARFGVGPKEYAKSVKSVDSSD